MLWNDRFTQGLPSLEKPDPFFITMYEQYISTAFPSGGTALDLAAGLGRHSLYLADRQWQTTAVDISDVAIEKIKASNHAIDTHVMDIVDYQFEPSSFDLIVLYYHFDSNLFKKIFDALKSGQQTLS
jgi:SAM-dependent methyltransferase